MSIDEYINKIIGKPITDYSKLLNLINMCKKNGYELMETEYNYMDLSVFCKVHGMFITTSEKLRENKRCGKCYKEHTVNMVRNSSNPHLVGMKQIPGFSNYYISEDARVYSTISEDFIVVNVEMCRTKNKRVRLKVYNDDNKRVSMDLSRLVALTYLENPENKPEVNHKDGNCYNNNLSNLEWNTIKENRDHAVKNKLIKPCDQGKRIDQYSLNGNFIKSYNSMQEACKENNISEDSIRDCISGKTKNPRYFIWKLPVQVKIENEIWKEVIIDSIQTGYMVSNFGRIKNKLGELLKGYKHQGNYVIIDITYKSNTEIKKASKRLHCLVASAFVPNPENKPEVDHIDTNVLNNKADNLIWSTRKENMNNETTKKKFEKPVEQLDENGKVINTFKSILEAKEYMKKTHNISSSGISEVCNNKKGYKTAGGFVWRFKKIE